MNGLKMNGRNTGMYSGNAAITAVREISGACECLLAEGPVAKLPAAILRLVDSDRNLKKRGYVF
jgi:hypothetical protein